MADGAAILDALADSFEPGDVVRVVRPTGELRVVGELLVVQDVDGDCVVAGRPQNWAYTIRVPKCDVCKV